MEPAYLPMGFQSGLFIEDAESGLNRSTHEIRRYNSHVVTAGIVQQWIPATVIEPNAGVLQSNTAYFACGRLISTEVNGGTILYPESVCMAALQCERSRQRMAAAGTLVTSIGRILSCDFSHVDNCWVVVALHRDWDPEARWKLIAPAQIFAGRAATTALIMTWSGIVRIRDEHYVSDGRGHRHRCLDVVPDNISARRIACPFTLNIDDFQALDNGTTVHVSGEVIAPNNGIKAMMFMYGDVEQAAVAANSPTGEALNMVEVNSRGRVLQYIQKEDNWDCMLVRHKVWVDISGVWEEFVAMYVDIGDEVLRRSPTVQPGAVVELKGSVLEFCKEGNMWAIHVIETKTYYISMRLKSWCQFRMEEGHAGGDCDGRQWLGKRFEKSLTPVGKFTVMGDADRMALVSGFFIELKKRNVVLMRADNMESWCRVE
ncbi:uncharacterized protein MELLADRAFT_113188 [Melampsora larici-populina 98AG31]|uniref:Uncharacterized protein n=1 Tax=Melampsora larici-populina (strain 98AG31 / pathotype 3-4-7) TaxID=747676 RepID=F4S922_MELLP|nr:uncharacterized protein MELLADRAFT_113188 [Melampsora larici-populina 98AG31]EGF98862.1 hypothetical protein MELLADRAFT_113188 [Melampsora larici-populina 98AG31]